MKKIILCLFLLLKDLSRLQGQDPGDDVPVGVFLNFVMEARQKPVAYEMEFRIRKNVLEKSNLSQKTIRTDR